MKRTNNSEHRQVCGSPKMPRYHSWNVSCHGHFGKPSGGIHSDGRNARRSHAEGLPSRDAGLPLSKHIQKMPHSSSSIGNSPKLDTTQPLASRTFTQVNTTQQRVCCRELSVRVIQHLSVTNYTEQKKADAKPCACPRVRIPLTSIHSPRLRGQAREPRTGLHTC